MSNARAVEQNVLGTILADPKCLPFIPMLSVTDFDDPAHQMIFQAMYGLADQGRHPSPIFLAPQFSGDLMGADQRPMSEYLRELAARKCVERDRLVDYIRTLKEFAARRMMRAMGQQMLDVAGEPGVSVQDFLDEVAETASVSASAIRQQRVTAFSTGQLHDAVIADLRAKREANLVKTGIDALDKVMGGYPRGELSILAGRPSMGKSTAATSGMRNAAIRYDVSSLLISLEMRGASMYQRMLSDQVWNSHTPILYERIMRGQLEDYEIDRLDRAGAKLRELDIEIEEQDALSIADIGIKARRYAEKLARKGRKLDTLIVDHMGFIQPSSRYRGSRVHEIGEITKGIKALAKELDCAGVALSQLNRKSEERDDKRPQMQDLRDSGDIEQDADTIVFVYREYYYLERKGVQPKAENEQWRLDQMDKLKDKIEFILGKRRNGPVFNAMADAFMGSNAIRSLVA